MTSPLTGILLDTTTRAGFLARAALGLGGLAGAGALRPAAALAQSDGDVGVLNLALTLERVQIAFFERGRRVAGSDVRDLTDEVLGHHREHADALTGLIDQLGGQAADAPRTRIRIADSSAFLATAVALQEAAIQAYDGAAPEITDPEILAAAGQIAQVEGRHAAAWLVASGKPPAPGAFEPALTARKAKAALEPFLATS